jgi:hypothetical protein
MKTTIKAFFNIMKVFQFNSAKDDPVKHCEVYARQGCTHVDGPLCDMRSCDICNKETKAVIRD